MRTWNISEDAPGRLVPYGRRSYYKPEPLPPSRELELSEEFYELLSGATFWLGRLSGISEMVDFPPMLYASLVRKEAVESAEIEGADVDVNDLYRYETLKLDDEADPDTRKDIDEVRNYETAVRQGVEAIDADDGITIDLLESLHETLLSGVRNETDVIGDFRRTPVHLGSFVPPAPPSVEGDVEALVSYIRSGGAYHDVIDTALVHYQFETIHPFGDGNGRLGRILITLQLYETGLLSAPNLYLSEYFNRNKETYVERMREVSRNGAWEEWLTFFVKGVLRQAREAYDRSLELRDLQREYEERYGNSSRADARLARRLFRNPYVVASEIAALLDVTKPTAYRAINTLEDEGILEEVTGKERNKEYRATEIFEILERPPSTY
ncbi:Fic family protein [Halorussus pelagicus]|uniref:Fic family protein n=1 Tax=Halorussus pelagicus TaxID=2505977 RepID=UPI000FFC3CC1